MPEPQNALTPEEWKVALNGAVRFSGDRQMFVLDDAVSVNLGRQYDEIFEGRERHKLAALCLYQQPFGFTHEDIEVLRKIVDGCDGDYGADPDDRVFADGARLYSRDLDRIRSLVQRIASLLPPSE